MARGRRPAGICGAALLLAARMNNFRRSVQEVVQVVKIADTTLKRRLEEFKKTPSGSLTLEEFRTVWLEEEVDPPAFSKAREKERGEAEDEGDDEADGEEGNGRAKGKRRKKKRKRIESDDEADERQETPSNPIPHPQQPLPLDPTLLNEGILAGTQTSSDMPLFLPADDEPHPIPFNGSIDPSLLMNTPAAHPPDSSDSAAVVESQLLPAPPSPLDEQATAVLTDEVTAFLTNQQGTLLASTLDEAEERRVQARLQAQQERFQRAQSRNAAAENGDGEDVEGEEEDLLLDLDEDELDQFIMTEEEVQIKERVWVEINKDYLEAIAGGSYR